jgi:hypothetical protein
MRLTCFCSAVCQLWIDGKYSEERKQSSISARGYERRFPDLDMVIVSTIRLFDLVATIESLANKGRQSELDLVILLFVQPD